MGKHTMHRRTYSSTGPHFVHFVFQPGQQQQHHHRHHRQRYRIPSRSSRCHHHHCSPCSIQMGRQENAHMMMMMGPGATGPSSHLLHYCCCYCCGMQLPWWKLRVAGSWGLSSDYCEACASGYYLGSPSGTLSQVTVMVMPKGWVQKQSNSEERKKKKMTY